VEIKEMLLELDKPISGRKDIFRAFEAGFSLALEWVLAE